MDRGRRDVLVRKGHGAVGRHQDPARGIRRAEVDLTDPDVKTFATPPCPDFIPDFQETPGMNVSTFVATAGLQVGINANF